MFARFFAAVRRLAEQAEGLADDIGEARSRFRANVLGGEEPAPARQDELAPQAPRGRKGVKELK